MSNVIDQYGDAVGRGDINAITSLLSPSIILKAPGSNQANEGKAKASMMLSVAAAVVEGFTFIRSYSGEDKWHAVLFEGNSEGTTVQFIDQVQLDDQNLVQHVDIFLRPSSMASILQEKISAEVKRRTA